MMGTDHPFDMGMYKPVPFVNGARLKPADKKAILGDNTARSLKLKRRR